jgi:hypothetical protein
MSSEYTGGGDYYIFKKYINEFLNGECPPSWPDILAENLSLNLKNKGILGSSNQTIFDTFINNFPNIKSGDTVIIQWTHLPRFRTPSINNKWIDILPRTRIVEKTSLNQNCIDQIFVVRENILYFEELCNLSKFLYNLSKLLGFNFYTWHLFDVSTFDMIKKYDKTYNLDWEQSILHTAKTEHDKIYADDVFQIHNATNGEIDDGHLSKVGHEYLSQVIFERIKRYE